MASRLCLKMLHWLLLLLVLLLLVLLQGWLCHGQLLLLLLHQRLWANSCWRCGLCNVETHLPVTKEYAGSTTYVSKCVHVLLIVASRQQNRQALQDKASLSAASQQRNQPHTWRTYMLLLSSSSNVPAAATATY
jgi:hypothetical protein